MSVSALAVDRAQMCTPTNGSLSHSIELTINPRQVPAANCSATARSTIRNVVDRVFAPPGAETFGYRSGGSIRQAVRPGGQTSDQS